MAVDISKLVSEVKEQVTFEQISNQTIAVDAFNTIYQFLSIIRQPDGSPLTDSKNRVTSHLSGILYRTINLLEFRILPIYVFDGIPPLLKRRTLEARANRRRAAEAEWQKAKAAGQLEEARTHAMASTKINQEIIESSKELLGYMGIPYIQAPSEGEAQASRMVRDGLVYATASQDYDSFLFGSDVVIRNLTISGRRKLPKKNIYIEVKPERVILSDLLKHLQISREQLIHLGMLVGTDFNTGIEKVGPKTALKIAKEYKTLEKMSAYVKEKYGIELDYDPQQVEDIFMKPETSEVSRKDFDAMVNNAKPDKEKIIKFMCSEHGFSQERVEKVADRVLELRAVKGQKGINNWM